MSASGMAIRWECDVKFFYHFCEKIENFLSLFCAMQYSMRIFDTFFFFSFLASRSHFTFFRIFAFTFHVIFGEIELFTPFLVARINSSTTKNYEGKVQKMQKNATKAVQCNK
jgi:hypothetical protein